MGLINPPGINRWPNGIVPYTIDSELNGVLILEAMREWESSTCIKFVERDPNVHSDFVHFRTSDRNYSKIGKIPSGGQQDIHLQNVDKPVVLHEIGHALGLWHEHQRSDRNLHVIPQFENIEDPDNFAIKSDKNDDFGAYDFDSIMHYPPKVSSSLQFCDVPVSSFQLLEEGTEILKPVSADIELKYNETLSKGDIRAVNVLYSCEGLKSRPNKLVPGDKFRPGEFMTSENGAYSLVMQEDGNLVVYRSGSIEAIWSSRTYGYDVHWAAMQEDDGNFVIYGEQLALWRSNTHGNPCASLEFENDGNIKIVAENGTTLLWESKTSLGQLLVPPRFGF